jgi:arginyl-tRNA synthetase
VGHGEALIPPVGLAAFLDSLLAGHDPERRCRGIELRSRREPYADVRLLLSDGSWLASAGGVRLVEACRRHPFVAGVRATRAAVVLRLSDRVIAELARDLLAGVSSAMGTGHLLAGRRVMVGFIGPNTCKALHLGHLRNIVLGDSLAAALAAAGASVVRENLVGDIGRSVGEAMAGCERHHGGEDPARLHVKPDQFVGRCYRDYLRGSERDEGRWPDPSREGGPPKGDLADRLLKDWYEGRAAARDLWQRLRRWVMQGHRDTLARLGTVIDRVDYESGGIDRGMSLVREALTSGVLRRCDGGRIVYDTGRAEYATLVLTREDGFPTEHTRLIGVYDRILDDCRDGLYVELAGDEWRPSAERLGELIATLRPGPRNERHIRLFHAMLTIGDAKLSSSEGEPLLVDELLDRLLKLPAVARLAARTQGAVPPAAIADLVLRGYFLGCPPSEPQRFVWDDFVDPERGLGWTIARAWCRDRDALTGRSEINPEDPEDRLLVLRSQSFVRVLGQAATQLDLTPVVRYLRTLVEDHLAAPAVPGRERLFLTVLGTILGALGFLAVRPAPEGTPAPATKPG